MEERIKELEHQLANKERKDENTTITEQSKNLETVPSNGRDNSITYITNNQTPNEMEVNDILQIISTTMAALKRLENRYKNTRSI